MKFEFLGTSDTGGIPLHLCSCSICEEARKKSTFNRSTSAFLELDDKGNIRKLQIKRNFQGTIITSSNGKNRKVYQ